jgi:uncharacterized protein YndB with AHSA1/START domain
VLKKVLIALLVVVTAFAGVVSIQPADFKVVRSASIAAPQANVFGLVNDFHKWEGWSPWAKIDPAMKTAYEGAPAGPGAIYKWTGNDEVGEGQMTILDTRPNELVRIKLDFLKPFESSNTTEFEFKPESSGVNVNWTMSGQNNFVSKAFCLVLGGMDKMVGPDFEKGLAQMKALAEAEAKK